MFSEVPRFRRNVGSRCCELAPRPRNSGVSVHVKVMHKRTNDTDHSLRCEGDTITALTLSSGCFILYNHFLIFS